MTILSRTNEMICAGMEGSIGSKLLVIDLVYIERTPLQTGNSP